MKAETVEALTDMAHAVGATSATVCAPSDTQATVETNDLRCATCSIVLPIETLKKNHCYCPRCGDMVCLICGCTDSRACVGRCWWMSPGVCSSHEEEGN